MKEVLIPLVTIAIIVTFIGLVLHLSGVQASITAAVVTGVFAIYPTLTTMFQ